MNLKQTNILDDHTAPILIVEDNIHYAKVLEKLLISSLGFDNITTTDNTEEAYDLIQKNSNYYKLLFVDFNFPVGDNGYSLIKKLKDNNLIEKKLIFLITSDPSYEKLKDVTSLGAVGIVGKPFNKEQIIDQLQKAGSFDYADSIEYF